MRVPRYRAVNPRTDECKLFEYHPKVRIDCFGDIPGEAHEEIAVNAQCCLRQSRFDRGFYWPEWVA
ncbi:hypothetical protein Q9L58_008419 [Maublancomyces gigas]|uniref:Uncharacterized protein n=1 Tax=Discina gigas TaxID=1032678 RepID=A0ABR3G9S0_9PEZI